MQIHILNGDSLLDRFLGSKLRGQVILNRECLIVGELAGNTLEEFWQTRDKFISNTYDVTENSYYDFVVSQFAKIIEAPHEAKFNLWFGYDLFCQANMWFILSILYDKNIAAKVSVVYPSYLEKDKIWEDFGNAGIEDLC